MRHVVRRVPSKLLSRRGDDRDMLAGKKGKGKTAKGKGAAPPEETHRCFHCQSDGAKMCCSQCHRAWYCGRPCQKKH